MRKEGRQPDVSVQEPQTTHLVGIGVGEVGGPPQTRDIPRHKVLLARREEVANL